MPYLPPGATLHSLATFLHRSCGARNGQASCLQYYRVPREKLEVGNPSGQGAQRLSTGFLGGMPSGTELIRRHTLIGLYGSVMCDRWWGNRLAAEIANGAPHWRGLNQALMHRPLSWCPECSREDFDQYGWAPWRVVHQPPFVHHCAVHGTVLLSICAQCNEPLGSGFKWRLPGDSCRKCKGNSFRPAFIVEQSFGYQRLLRVLASLNHAMTSGKSMLAIKSPSWVDWGEEQIDRFERSIDQLSAEWDLTDLGVSIPMLLGVREGEFFLSYSMTVPPYASPLATLLFASLLPEFD